ncbi:MAG: exosome complex RNA-binding protein Csl4 [Candidatus Micrarchaeota archaeon]
MTTRKYALVLRRELQRLMSMKTPGEFLGTEEEYVPGYGAYQDKSEIRASLYGELGIDKERRMNIDAKCSTPVGLKPGMVVYGRVEEIFEPVALIRAQPIEAGRERQVIDQFYCVLHVSRVKMGYARSIRDEVRIGDIIKAVVDEIGSNEIYLSTKRGGMGVIKAFCARCRSPLSLDEQELTCGCCENKEKRKLGSPYGRI